MEQEKKKSNHWDLFSVNLFLLAIVALMLLFGELNTFKTFSPKILITQFGIIFGGSLIYLLIRKKNIKQVLSLRPFKIKTMVLVLLSSLLLLPIISFLNMVMSLIMINFGDMVSVEIPRASSPLGLLGMIFVVAVTAGICEETMFRGVLFNTYQKYFTRRTTAILIGIIFATFHLNLVQFFGPLLLGIYFVYLIQITDSIFVVMAAHFFNNAVAVIIDYFAHRSSIVSVELEQELTTNDLVQSILSILPFIGLLSLICALLVYSVLKAIKRNNPKRLSEVMPTQEISLLDDFKRGDYRLWTDAPKKYSKKWLFLSFTPIMVFGIFYIWFIYTTTFQGA